MAGCYNRPTGRGRCDLQARVQSRRSSAKGCSMSQLQLSRGHTLLALVRSALCVLQLAAEERQHSTWVVGEASRGRERACVCTGRLQRSSGTCFGHLFPCGFNRSTACRKVQLLGELPRSRSISSVSYFSGRCRSLQESELFHCCSNGRVASRLISPK